MLYLPFEQYEIESTLSPEEVKARIAANVETQIPMSSFFYSGSKKFKGKIGEDRFLISRIIQYQNSFLPIIKGVIYPNAFGSKIKISMRLNKFVLGFWILWMGIVSLLIIGFLPSILSKPKFEHLLPFLMLAFGYFLCIIPFNIEAVKARKLLKDRLCSGS